ncbi:hypothetical protein EV426DRAFT_80563 [Tirmania nivea]|nr:hypothetical protein EV426DRAFT_80563 [Tirmania nivea]
MLAKRTSTVEPHAKTRKQQARSQSMTSLPNAPSEARPKLSLATEMNGSPHLLSPGPQSVTPSTPPRQPPPRSPLSNWKQNRDRRPHSSQAPSFQHHEMSPPSQLHPSTPPSQNKGKGRATSSNEQLQQASSKNSVLDTQMEKFDFDDFRARFDAMMQPHMARDKELVDEYKRVVQTHQAWVGVLGQFDQEQDINRREKQITSLQQKEDELETYRREGQAAVQDIQSILERIGALATSRAPSRQGNNNHNSNQNSNTSQAPRPASTSRPASRNAGPGGYRTTQQQQPQHRLSRGFIGSKVAGGNASGSMEN